VWVVLRKTWGWLENVNDKNSPKKKMDRIALSQFAEMTGINRRKCHALLKKLIEKNIILKTVTHIGDGTYINYGFQKDFDLWGPSPIKGTSVPNKGTVPNMDDRVSPILGTRVSPIRAHTKERKETIKETHQLFEFVDPFIDYMIKVKKNKAPEKTKSLIEKSIDTIDKLIRLDGFELEYIKKVSRWAVKDDFWSIAFFSLAPLRKKSDNGATKFANMAARYDSEPGNAEPEILTKTQILKKYGAED